MIERLTIITPKGAALKLDNPKNEKEARKQLMDKYKIAVDKLAHYEDLEEQGRLLVLPKGFDLESLKNILFAYCPSYVGLANPCCLNGECAGGNECIECWEKAWKGE